MSKLIRQMITLCKRLISQLMDGETELTEKRRTVDCQIATNSGRVWGAVGLFRKSPFQERDTPQ
jgi:hypothetical protein